MTLSPFLPDLSQSAQRLLAELAANRHLQLRRTASLRRKFYAVDLSRPEITRSRPVNQQAAIALERAGLIAERLQTGQHLPDRADRQAAPFIWDLTPTAVALTCAR